MLGYNILINNNSFITFFLTNKVSQELCQTLIIIFLMGATKKNVHLFFVKLKYNNGLNNDFLR